MADLAGLGPNAGLVDEMYRRWQESPGSLAPAWQEFFADYTPRGAAAPFSGFAGSATGSTAAGAGSGAAAAAGTSTAGAGAAAPRGV